MRELRASGLAVATGEFQAMMQVELVNDGPVTILVDSTQTVLMRHAFLCVAALVVLQPVLVFAQAAAAVAYSLQQQHRYRATAEVLLGRQSSIANLTGTPDLQSVQDPQRIVDTQAALARVPEVARRTLESVHLTDRTPLDFLDQSSVSSSSETNLLSFNVTDPLPSRAKQLASAYAAQFSGYTRELDTAAIDRALTTVRARLRSLGSGGKDSPLYVSLLDKEQQLETALALEASPTVVRPADHAKQVQPRPVRNGILALVVGLLLGIALAFGREALDTRVRNADAIGRILGLPLLGRIPQPPRRLRKSNKLVTLSQPGGTDAEAFSMLRTNLQFANLNVEARTILFTSSVEGEGKSTTIANLAIALARTGQRVVLVDLDLRRPFLHRFFGRDPRPGVTDTAVGGMTVDEALAHGAITPPAAEGLHPVGVAAPTAGRNGTNGSAVPSGSLSLITCGSIPPDPAEFSSSKALRDLLAALADRADIILVDTPPLLRVGDALSLSASVDALVIVTRIDTVRKRMLSELRRVLDASQAVPIGFVVTGAGDEDGRHETYGYYGYKRPYYQRETETVR